MSISFASIENVSVIISSDIFSSHLSPSLLLLGLPVKYMLVFLMLPQRFLKYPHFKKNYYIFGLF